MTAASTAAVTVSYGTFLSVATVLSVLTVAQIGSELRRRDAERLGGGGEPVLDDTEAGLVTGRHCRPGCGGDPSDATREQRDSRRASAASILALSRSRGGLRQLARRDGAIDRRDRGRLGRRGERRLVDPERGGERLAEGRAVLPEPGGTCRVGAALAAAAGAGSARPRVGRSRPRPTR